MSSRLCQANKQGGIIDIDVVRGYSSSAQLEYIGEWKRHKRAIVAGIGDFTLATRRVLCTPEFQQSVLTRRYRREEAGDASSNGLLPYHRYRIPKAKLRIWRQKIHEGSGIASVDCRKQSLPPLGIWHEGAGAHVITTGDFVRGKHVPEHTRFADFPCNQKRITYARRATSA
jgi:hypothetical protein